MRITRLHLENFKRFTYLTLARIPPTAKLVLLIGANGSGKSSIFDAFYALSGFRAENNYYLKDIDNYNYEVLLDLDDNSYLHIYRTDISQRDVAIVHPSKKFIGRPAIRIIPRISESGNVNQIAVDKDRPNTFIDNDLRLANDVFTYMQRIDNALREPAFQGKSADTLKIFQDAIQPLNDSLRNIFGQNTDTTIQIARYKNPSPTETGQLIFRKGDVEINYDLLSHGEKQVVILLLNFIVRQDYYKDAIIFIDEMDAHLNTSLQQALMHEILTKWIPDSSQFWTATHALGFIDYANKSNEAAIIDFDNLNFDLPQTIYPSTKEGMEVYDIAIPKDILFDLLSGKQIVVCENQNDEYYNLLNLKDTIFVGVKDARDVFLTVKRDVRYKSLRDRDFLSDDEIDRIQKQYPNHRILRYYDFENYLYHPDNLEELQIADFDKEAYIREIVKQKNERLLAIVANLNSSRQSYEEFKTDEKLKAKEPKAILADLQSDDFEQFYKYFDMKAQFNKGTIQTLILDKSSLVKTSWFKSHIAQLLA